MLPLGSNARCTWTVKFDQKKNLNNLLNSLPLQRVKKQAYQQRYRLVPSLVGAPRNKGSVSKAHRTGVREVSTQRPLDSHSRPSEPECAGNLVWNLRYQTSQMISEHSKFETCRSL